MSWDKENTTTIEYYPTGKWSENESLEPILAATPAGINYKQPEYQTYEMPFHEVLQVITQYKKTWHKQAETRLPFRIAEVIDKSRSILELKDNWDEEGSPGEYSETTLIRATNFIKEIVLSYRNQTNTWITPPRVTPGPDRSIDVRWKAAKRTLLINFPSNDLEPPDFFGSDTNIDIVKGSLDLSYPNEWLLVWLTR